MNDTELEISRTVGIFVKIAQHKEARLQHGAELRREMHDAIKDGRTPTGYRPQWIRASANIVISLLGEIAADFDSKHPDDKASLADLMDVVATAMGVLKKQSDD